MSILSAVVERHTELDGSSDARLVEVALEGCENAVRLLIKRNNQRLFRVARAVLHSDGEAEDVVQETYVRAFTKLHTFRHDSSFSTWLTRIALNDAMGRVRRRRPLATMDDLDSAAASGEGGGVIMFPTSLIPPAADAEVARSQVRAFLEQAVDDLPESFRIVFILRDIEDMTTEETAEHLSVKPETVKTRLHRARRLLRAAIQARLSPTFAELFPFDGARCERMADRVVDRLRTPAGAEPTFPRTTS
ncbi:RNA polymerase sigma factor [Aurantimonas sp. C2-6-R+9]|uniref:RNA polymerase sigma factor n=1 Tax=unclassified Aurantimonas TaxID=2638230 RepID=UPI002E19EF09|nr:MULTISPECIES: RNA polymerase sigma factor [unclassified Aurantimonas]MEC5293203.1 RNA polymerase sigma factor [Aurantimonas sp. C2-3-R2]MEC5383364.1 RNA polymerase sigma factor [Aurantimonas sp. C2-6-R+9]MEC5414297.1 RNA polymerase sigma factor [Aurantimonas sp. C2-4-R8]